jgi:hypothetical protein
MYFFFPRLHLDGRNVVSFIVALTGLDSNPFSAIQDWSDFAKLLDLSFFTCSGKLTLVTALMVMQDSLCLCK